MSRYHHQPEVGQRRGTTRVDASLSELSPEKLMRMWRLGRELRLTDQILSEDLDTLTITNNGPAPAWTTLDGDHISFALDRMPFPDTEYHVAVWLGTNAHELGHVMRSPRRESTLMRRVMAADSMLMPRLMQLHNIVEDQREERLTLAYFSPWTAYLVAALGYHLHVTDDSAWLLLAGRTWLSDDIRAAARERFVMRQDEPTTQKVTTLIGQYQRLLDPGEDEANYAWTILEELHDLLADSLPPTHVCGVINGGEPITDAPNDDVVYPTADEDPNPGQPGPDEEPGEGEAKGEGSTTSKAETGEKGTGGTGAGNTSGPKGKQRDIEKELQKAIEEAAKGQLEEDEAAKEDVKSVLDALDQGRSGGEAEGRPAEGRYVPASDGARRLHREVGDALLDLKDASEPGWVRRQDSGRISIRRWAPSLISPDVHVEADELFDRYEPGQMDASEMEVVLCVDVSGSMGRFCTALGEAVWAIRCAVDDLDGRSTVLAYESGPHYLLNEPNQRPDDRMFIPESLGGTEPSSALREAWSVLADSLARNRLLVILSDGHWHSRQGDKVVRAMNDTGITTVLALLRHSYYNRPVEGEEEKVKELAKDELHGCQFGADIAGDPYELARLFRRVATDRINRWM